MRYSIKYPERYAANIAVSSALRTGTLLPWPVCAMPECSTTDLVAHHPDYSRPLDVVWLCQVHHRAVHVSVHTACKRPQNNSIAFLTSH